MSTPDEYVRHIAEAGLLDKYQEIMAVAEEGVALETQQPGLAVQKFRKALRMVEDTGAVAGAKNHPLFRTRATLISFLGDLV